MQGEYSMSNMDNEMSKRSMIKTYKLSKTFENSTFPLELELRAMHQNTVASTLNNVSGIIFSGVGTTIISGYIKVNDWSEFLVKAFEWNKGIQPLIQISILTLMFVILYAIGVGLNTFLRKKEDLSKKKNTSEGRSELCEIFHKSIINEIVTGVSFVNKAEEMNYDGDVATMYLYEAAYYFKEAKVQMEEMGLLTGESGIKHQEFIDQIGANTVRSTCEVYLHGLEKLYGQIPDGSEKARVKDIATAIETLRKHA